MLKKTVKKLLNSNTAIKRYYYNYRIKKGEKIIERSTESLSKINLDSIKDKQNVNILLVSIPSLPTSVVVDMLLAKALVKLGCNVTVLLIDPCLKADLSCEISIIKPAELLEGGAAKLSKLYNSDKNIKYWERSGVKLIKLSDYIGKSDSLKISRIIPEGIEKQIEIHAMAGALRYFAIGKLDCENVEHNKVYREYYTSSKNLLQSISIIDEEYSFNTFICVNGIYVPGGIVNAYANALKKNFICWNIAYRQKCLLFSHEDTYHHTLMNERSISWDSSQFPSDWESIINNYLHSRIDGGRDWIVFNKNATFENPEVIKEKYNIKKPLILVLTNVIWDAQLHYPANAFKDMLEWIDFTVEKFWARKDLNVMIRVHPAEISGDIPTRQRVSDHLKMKFPDLPEHFTVIDANEKISTYALAEICDAAIIYGTKTGLELTARGIPVIVCGEAWVRGKGFTIDINDKESYENLINSLPLLKRLDEITISKAREYAYHFFFRKMIPISSVKVTGSEPRLEVDIIEPDNFPYNDSGLMTICKSIINRDPFVYNISELK